MLFLIAYYLYFSWPGLRAPFAVDTFMNMDLYWRWEPSRLAISQLEFWGGHYRPMGGIFYMLLFHYFGLNPTPYHIATSLIVLFNGYLFYRFARLLGCDELTSGLAALIGGYHFGLRDIYYNTSFIYDVLCFSFYFGCFVYYASIRQLKRLPRAAETGAILLLYICALNSKEMAVTLPLALAAYEWIYHRPHIFNAGSAFRWLKGPGRTALLTSLLTALYIYGKTHGPEAMTASSGYHPVLSWSRVLAFHRAELSDFLLMKDCSWALVLLGAFTLLYIGWRTPHRHVRFCAILIAVMPLPIEFLEARRGACLYIPLLPWAVVASTLFRDLAGALGGFLSRAFRLHPFSRRTVELLIVIVGVCFWAAANLIHQLPFVPAMAKVGGESSNIIQQLKTVSRQPPPGSEVLFINDPLGDLTMKFIADLWFRDRSLKVSAGNWTSLAVSEDLGNFPYCFEFRSGKLFRGCNIDKESLHSPGTTPNSALPARAGTYDDFDPALTFRGIWHKSTEFDGPASHTITYTDFTRAEIVFSFHGSSLTYVFSRAFNRGRAELLIDGARKALIDLYAPQVEWQSRVTVTGLPASDHVAVVRVLGQRSDRSSGTFVDLDSFVVE